MKKNLLITIGIIFTLVSSTFAQKLTEPKLIGTWQGGEDFGEFIYHKIEEIKFSYLEDYPKGKIVARICSNNKLPVALASSVGYAQNLLTHTQYFKIPSNQIYLARSAKCIGNTKTKYSFEQYWFIPEDKTLDTDEIVPIDNVRVERLLVDDYNEKTKTTKTQFADLTKEFINKLKNSSKAQGFIISTSNNKNVNRNIKKATEQLSMENINSNRFQIIKKETYESYYPEFMIITIKY